MKANFTDKFRIGYKGFMEPLLLTACKHEGEKLGISRSKFLRYAAILLLIEKEYPLKTISNKFNDFYRAIRTKR